MPFIISLMPQESHLLLYLPVLLSKRQKQLHRILYFECTLYLYPNKRTTGTLTQWMNQTQSKGVYNLRLKFRNENFLVGTLIWPWTRSKLRISKPKRGQLASLCSDICHAKFEHIQSNFLDIIYCLSTCKCSFWY